MLDLVDAVEDAGDVEEEEEEEEEEVVISSSLSNSLVIVQISFLFAYQTIVLGFNPIAKHRYVCCVLCVFFFFNLLVLVGRSIFFD